MVLKTDLENQLARLAEVGIALSSELDLKTLLARILQEARCFTQAEAGSLYLVENDTLHFVVAQNDALAQRAGDASKSTSFLNKQIPLTPESLAGYVGLTGNIINLEDSYQIPSDRPYHFNSEFDQRYEYRSRSMLLVPMKQPDGKVVGVLQLINARDAAGHVIVFDTCFERLVMSLASQAAVTVRNMQLNEQLKGAYYETVLRLCVAAEFKDEGTAEHIHRMAQYSVLLANEAGLSPNGVELLRYAAPMHDVGKIGIPDAILRKPGKLTPAEYEEMKQHTIIGAKILGGSEAPVLKLSATIALTHHEKFDGSGYPQGLRGEQIPIEGRIVALADVFDALSSARAYKPALPKEQCLELIRQGRGKHFDPDLVDVFLSSVDDMLFICGMAAELEAPAAAPEPRQNPRAAW